MSHVERLFAVADAIDLARYQHPQNPRERPRPFNEACPSDQEYAIRMARAAIAALPAPAGVEDWQPIETAPKDGTRILWSCGDDKMSVVSWPDYELCFEGGYWQPLPAPPIILANPAQEGQGS